MVSSIIQRMRDTGHSDWADFVARLQDKVDELRRTPILSGGLKATAESPRLWRWTIIVGDQEFRDMWVESEWEHFRKFRDADGRIIILAERGRAFSNVFNIATGDADRVEYTIVMASLEIAKRVTQPAQVASED